MVYAYQDRDWFINDDQLITHSPSLKELTLTSPTYVTFTNFARLKFLNIQFTMSEQKRNPELGLVDPLEIVAKHFWIPTLIGLQVRRIRPHPDRLSHPFPQESHRTSTITDLRVMDCDDNDLDILPGFILSVKALKRFTLVSAPYSWPPPHMRPANCNSPDWFARTLRPHQSTLVDLVIAGGEAASFLRLSVFGYLASYTNLKRLGVPETFLVHRHSSTLHELLPPSLKVLQLQFPMGGNMEPDDELHFVSRGWSI